MKRPKRTSIFLDEALINALKRLAARRGVSFARVVREAASAYVAQPVGMGAMPSVAGRFASRHKDTASRVDDLLWKSPHA